MVKEKSHKSSLENKNSVAAPLNELESNETIEKMKSVKTRF